MSTSLVTYWMKLSSICVYDLKGNKWRRHSNKDLGTKHKRPLSLQDAVISLLERCVWKGLCIMTFLMDVNCYYSTGWLEIRLRKKSWSSAVICSPWIPSTLGKLHISFPLICLQVNFQSLVVLLYVQCEVYKFCVYVFLRKTEYLFFPGVVVG